MKGLLSKLILAPAEKMFFISQGTNLLCKKLHFCFSVLLSPVSHAHRNTTVATSDRLNYLIFY